LAPNAVLGGDPFFVDFAMDAENQRPISGYAVYLSPNVDNVEWEQRIALNGFLRGLDRSSFEAEESASLGPKPGGILWGPWTRDRAELETRMASRLALFDAISANPAPYFDRYALRYVALKSGGGSPAYLDSRWRCLERGRIWDIWERLPDDGEITRHEPRGPG
jgi:hypothetical protein